MRSSSSRQTPFDEGAASVKTRDDMPNPFAENSVEFGNFELGRAHALRGKTPGTTAYPKTPAELVR